jgi:hypothetical protein
VVAGMFDNRCGHLYGYFIENRNTVIIELYLNHSTVLEMFNVWLKFTVE